MQQSASDPTPSAASPDGAASPVPANVRLVRVRMHHTDLMGGVYHGTYFDLFEDARSEIFRDLGYTYTSCTEGEHRLMVIVHAACDYKRPAKMDEMLAIAVTVSEITRTKMTFMYELRNADTGTLVAIGRNVFAFLDMGTGRPTSVPPRLVGLVKETDVFGWKG